MVNQKSSKIEIIIALVFVLIVLVPLLAIFWNILVPLFSFDFSAFATLADARILNLFGRSLLLSVGVVICTTLVAFPFAFIFSNYSFRLKGILFLFTLLPLFIPPYLSAISWQYALGGEGWLRELLHLSTSTQIISGFGGSLFILTIWLFPLMMLFIYNALRIGKSYLEAAKLHRTFWPRFKFVIVLTARHGIISGAILTFVLVFTNFSVPGALQLNVFPTEIFAQFGAFYNPGQAAVLSIPNLFIAILLAFLISYQFRQQKRYALHGNSQSFESLKGWETMGIYALFLVIIVILIVIPIASLISRMGSPGVFIDAFVSTWPQWMNSFLFGLAGAVVVCGSAFFLALYSRNKPRIQQILMAILLLPLFISGGLYAIGLIEVWNQPLFNGVIYGSSTMVVLSYFRFIPIGYFLISTAMLKLPIQYEEIGMLSGRKKRAMVSGIIFPLVKQSVFGGMLLVFIFCFSELDTAVLTYPPGMETISVRIFSLLHYGTHETVAALCLWQILIIIALVLVTGKWSVKVMGK